MNVWEGKRVMKYVASTTLLYIVLRSLPSHAYKDEATFVS
jgi:hypothetical protein